MPVTNRDRTSIHLASDLAELFFPRICMGCQNHLRKFENGLCHNCQNTLPRSLHWIYIQTPIEALFYGRVPVDRACTFLNFSKGSRLQTMMHGLKYDGRRDIGLVLGELFGRALTEHSFFGPIDLMVPVPLHPARQLRRGYNQSEVIAQGMADGVLAPVNTKVLMRPKVTESQTRKGRFERFENMDGVFHCPKPDLIKGRHILLIDDVVTTGSTIGACALILLANGAEKVSIAALAHAVG